MSSRNESALVFPPHPVIGRKSLWEVWPRCTCGDGFKNAAAGALDQLFPVRGGLPGTHYTLTAAELGRGLLFYRHRFASLALLNLH